ncbi:MAG TPA: metallophosphoesterase family protein [Gaiellaceae bacterium]|nr:metallophosphoesterase family protein [Gaiellaceae bacterium]
MRVAALYDVHGNLPALEAVLADVERDGVDAVVCGGDVCAGPMPRECLDALADAIFVRGNADRELGAWPAARLDAAQRAFLADLPVSVTLDVDGLGPTVFCHATPRSDEEIVTGLTPDHAFTAVLAEVEEPVVVAGHVHVRVDRVVGRHRYVNPGSVGMPYQGRRGAFWAVLGPRVDFRRTEYDVEDAVARIRGTGYPDAEQLAEWLLEPVDPEETSRYFESQRA